MSDLEGPQCYIPRLERTMREIPDKYHNALWDLTGAGRSPKTVQAAVCYVESIATQEEAAAAFDVTAFSVREVTRELVDRGVVALDDIPVSERNNGEYPFGTNRNDDPESGGLRWEPDS